MKLKFRCDIQVGGSPQLTKTNLSDFYITIPVAIRESLCCASRLTVLPELYLPRHQKKPELRFALNALPKPLADIARHEAPQPSPI